MKGLSLLRVLLVALNAKFVHTNLALRYLREEARIAYPELLLREFSINEQIEQIAAEIYETKADVIGFSCYIWNIKEIGALISRLRPVCPDVLFILGGPEVSFDVEDFFNAHPEADVLVIGEGETIFLQLLKSWESGQDFSHMPGIATRDAHNKIVVNLPRSESLNLNNLPQPYQEKEDFTGRIVYVETTRGCPFNCQYCLSSTDRGVRFLEPERFRRIFRQLISMGARTIKFVDRTFNANKDHAFQILDIVREESVKHQDLERIRVHCEFAGDLLDQEWLSYLRDYPLGLIQLEIGVQSTNEPTLEAISRSQKFGEWKHYVPELQALEIPIHLDLIAGLPEENWVNFRRSFNHVYEVQPDMLQLGFLKGLKGSGLRKQGHKYGLVFTSDPPYTILETRILTHGEILQLHRMEVLLDKYYNSGKFSNSLLKVLILFSSPFDFYHSFAEFWHRRGWFQQRWHGKALFDRLWEFIETIYLLETDISFNTARREQIRDSVRFDYYLWERPNIVPSYLSIEARSEWEGKADEIKTWQDKIRQDDIWGGIIPESRVLDRRQWYRNTAVTYFASDILDEGGMQSSGWYLFYYQHGKVKAYRCEK